MTDLEEKLNDILDEKETKIIAGNIKKDVEIFDITGNLVELKGETKTVTPTTSSQTITPTTGKNGITEITVNPVTYSIDNNITAGNIKKDVTILGVTGTYEGSGGGTTDFSQYFNASIAGGNSTTAGRNNGYAMLVKKIPITITPTGTTMKYAFYNTLGLEEAPQIDFSNVTDASYLFSQCSALMTVPVYDWSNLTVLSNMFGTCANLSDTAIDNIMQSCITATSAPYPHTLAMLGLTSTNYSSATIQTLPHYQDFVNAGWAIGF